LCSQCEAEATNYCIDCGDEEGFLCDEHNKIIHSFKKKKDHKVVDAKEAAKFYQEVQSTCPEHKYPLDFWCEVCSKVVCNTCRSSVKHKEHRKQVLLIEDELYVAEKEKLKGIVNSKKKTVNDITNSVYKYELGLCELKEGYYKGREIIQAGFKELIISIEKRRDQLLTELSDKYDQQQKATDSSYQTYKYLETTIRSEVVMVDEILAIGDKTQFFHALSKNLTQIKDIIPDIQNNPDFSTTGFPNKIDVQWSGSAPSNHILPIQHINIKCFQKPGE